MPGSKDVVGADGATESIRITQIVVGSAADEATPSEVTL